MTSTTTLPLDTEPGADVNFCSLIADGWVVYFAGRPDMHYGEIPDPPHFLPNDPKAFDAILKLSGRTDTRLFGVQVAQGKENAIDLNNSCADIVIEGDIGFLGNDGEQVITVKGGSKRIRVAGEVWSTGARADVVVGLWSDQSTEVSGDLDFSGLSESSARMIVNRPLTFILCRVNSPIMAALGKPKDIKLPPGAKVLFWKSLVCQAGWWLKLAAVKAGFYGKAKHS